MSTITMPRVGDKVRAFDIPMFSEYEGTIVTLTDINDGTMRAEFPSKQKPDDTVRLSFNRFEWPACPTVEVGDKVRATDVPSVEHANGQIATVTRVFSEGGKYDGDRSLPYIEADFPSYTDDDGRPHSATNWCIWGWEKADESSFTPDYTPAVGDRVVVSGYLGSERIEVFIRPQTGQITSVDGNIWCVHIAAVGHVVTGPGYVAKAPAVADGATLTVSSDEGRMAELERQLARANERVTEATNRAGMWERDFGRYAERVKDEAIERDWCDEYERVMNSIKDELEIAEIPERRKNRVQVLRRVEAKVYRDVRVWVDEDDQYTTDTDEMYADRDDDDPVGDEWPNDIVVDEYDNNGFDEVNVETR